MITSNFIHRIFRIKCDGIVGTGFTVDVDGKQYLVTARHVVQNFGSAADLEVFGNGAWMSVPAVLVAHGCSEIDVSVIAPKEKMSPANLHIDASSNGAVYGQDVYFLGFPYGVLSQVVFGETGYPLPLVKKAIISSFAGDILLLDGHNNPGFSGGPVIFGAVGGMPNSVAAIVSGYRSTYEPVFKDNTETNLKQTDLKYQYNTGIIISYKVETALKMIRGNPIGVDV